MRSAAPNKLIRAERLTEKEVEELRRDDPSGVRRKRSARKEVLTCPVQ